MISDKYLKSREFFDSFSAAIKLAVLFLIGVGNYRSVLFLIVYFCVKAFVDYKNKHEILSILFLPPFIFTLYFDIINGQLWLPHKYNLIIFVIAFVVIDHTMTMYINAIVEKYSNNYVFSYCSKCKYENIKLTTKCKNCGYDRSISEPIETTQISNVYNSSFKSQLPGLMTELDLNTITNLSLADYESIYMSLKVSFGDGPHIDGRKQLCKFIVITNKNIILIHKLCFQRGWRWREKIDLKSVTEILAQDQNFSTSTRQAIKLYAASRTIEIVLWPFYKKRCELDKYVNAISCHILEIQKQT